jgi:hypothetical protein
MGLLTVVVAAPADAQGNLDAGKSPAQIFSSTCASCHRSPRELRRAGAGFLRSHYTTGPDEATLMANYLAGNPTPPPTAQRQPPGANTAGTNPTTPGNRQPKNGQTTASKKGRPGDPKSTATILSDARPPEAVPDTRSIAPPVTPPPPVLEPFEE